MIDKLKLLVLTVTAICLLSPVAFSEDFYKDDGVTYPIIRHIGLVAPDIIEIEIDEGRFEGGKIEAREPSDAEIRRRQHFEHAGQSYVNTFHTSDITRIANWDKTNEVIKPDNGFPDFRQRASYVLTSSSSTSLSIADVDFKVLPTAGYG